MSDEHLIETVTSSDAVYLGKLINLYVDHVTLPNGSTSIREIIRHPGAVAMVPLLPDHHVLLVRQFRLAANRVTLEIPAGTLTPGEDPLAAAGRELAEETGYRAATFTPLGGQFTAPGYTTEFIHLYLATDLEPAHQGLDEDEFLDVVRMPFDEIVQRIVAGDIDDSKTMSAILLAARRLGR